jgi:hypothetical protein
MEGDMVVERGLRNFAMKLRYEKGDCQVVE